MHLDELLGDLGRIRPVSLSTYTTFGHSELWGV